MNREPHAMTKETERRTNACTDMEEDHSSSVLLDRRDNDVLQCTRCHFILVDDRSGLPRDLR